MEISRLFSENVVDRGDRLSKLAADVDGSKNFESGMIDTAVNRLTNESDHVERKGPRKWRRPTSLPIVLEPALQDVRECKLCGAKDLKSHIRPNKICVFTKDGPREGIVCEAPCTTVNCPYVATPTGVRARAMCSSHPAQPTHRTQVRGENGELLVHDHYLHSEFFLLHQTAWEVGLFREMRINLLHTQPSFDGWAKSYNQIHRSLIGKGHRQVDKQMFIHAFFLYYHLGILLKFKLLPCDIKPMMSAKDTASRHRLDASILKLNPRLQADFTKRWSAHAPEQCGIKSPSDCKLAVIAHAVSKPICKRRATSRDVP